MDVAVVGHVEWITFLRADAPVHPGAIVRASERWEEAAGGGGVAAAELARLAGTATLITGLGTDAAGDAVPAALGALGVDVVATRVPGPHRTGVTVIDPAGERTIVVVGPAQAPGPERVGTYDLVYVCKGDAAAVRAARRSRVLVSTARVLPTLQEAGVPIDVLVRSANDPGERYAPGDLDPPPALVAETDGARGGRWYTHDRSGRWDAAPLPGPIRDAYGCGDSFAAALGFAIAQGQPVEQAVAFAAARGAAALCRRGAHG